MRVSGTQRTHLISSSTSSSAQSPPPSAWPLTPVNSTQPNAPTTASHSMLTRPSHAMRHSVDPCTLS
eukprot:COSAG02_NODE_374_length_23583_cov_12.568855_2_plen_67_part_00